MKILKKLFTEHNYTYSFLLLALFAAVLAGSALLRPGLPPTHDGEYHLIRFYEFDKVLREGNWYPRWAPDLLYGYGMPLFTYVYPLPNYVASLFHFFGASFLDSVKLNMFAATLIGGILFYFFARQFWGNKGGLVASVFYTFSPYHFVDIYVRGSVGEVWALALFPGFLWTYTKFSKTHNPIFIPLSALFLALTVFSHNILGLLFFCFALSYIGFCIFESQQEKFIMLHSLLIILLSLSLSSIFWLPALLQTKYVAGLEIFDIKSNFPDYFQLLFPSWGTGFYAADLNNQMSLQIGTANLLAIVGSVIAFVVLLKKKKPQTLIIGFFLAWFFFVFYLLLPVSFPFWSHIPLMHYFQFPWRLLSLQILICSFLAGSLTTFRYGRILTVILILLAILTTLDYAHPAYYMLRNDAYYTSRSNFIDGTNSPGNLFHTLWNPNPTQRAKEILTSPSNITRTSSTLYRGSLVTSQTTDITTNLTYFPTWKVLIDTKPIQTRSQNGLLTFSLPSGNHSLFITQQPTPIERIGEWLFFLSAITIFMFFFSRQTNHSSER